MKKIFIILLFLALGLGMWLLLGSRGMYFLTGSHNGTFQASRGGADVSRKTKDAGASVEKSLRETFAKGKAGLSNTASAVANVPKKAIGKVLGAFDAAIDDAKEYLGIPSAAPAANVDDGEGTRGGGASIVFSPLGQVVRKGQPITFVVNESFFKKNNVDAISVSVDWGDGESEHRAIGPSSENRFLAHAFQEIGEYKVLFMLEAGGGKTQQGVVVFVQE